jgi:RNA polymerase sigma-70 factor (ECF subfamily)
MVSTSDSLLERLRQPDRDAWARFVELYTPLLQRWTWRLGLQEADAADLVQDVFGILIQKLPGFAYDPGRSFRGWLRTVLVHRWHNWPRRGEVPLNADLPGADPADDVQEEEFRHYLVGRALKIMQADFEPTTWKRVGSLW